MVPEAQRFETHSPVVTIKQSKVVWVRSDFFCLLLNVARTIINHSLQHA